MPFKIKVSRRSTQTFKFHQIVHFDFMFVSPCCIITLFFVTLVCSFSPHDPGVLSSQNPSLRLDPQSRYQSTGLILLLRLSVGR